MELQVRPGFNLEATFKGHSSSGVRGVLRNPNNGLFVSADDKSLKSWSVRREGTTQTVQSVTFPSYQSTFFTSMCMAPSINMLFASCLDGNLRLYSDRLLLKSCMAWHNGLVRDMVYNERRDELITAGSYGVKVWTCLFDHEAQKTDKNISPYTIPRTKDGVVVPWGFGKYQNVKQRLLLRLAPPGKASDPAAAGAVEGGAKEKEPAAAPWSDKMVFHSHSQLLFCMYEGGIYGFEMGQGNLVMRFANLHKTPIMTMVYLPDSEMLITSALDSGAVVWRLAGGEPHFFKAISSSAQIIHSMTTDPGSKRLLTAAGDGCVTLWDIDTLLPVYKMKLSRPAMCPTFFSPTRFFLHIDSDIKLFSIQNLYEGWMECNSDPVYLKQLSYGLILAEFQDSSVRLLDCASTSPDKSAATTVPQLSMHALVSAFCSLSTGRLFTLLSNSHIHVWEIHLKGPPTFLSAWTHLGREACVCMADVDGELCDKGVVSALGMECSDGVVGDHLLLGTGSGDLIVCSIARGGVPIFRFPAFKHQPLQHIEIDLDRQMLVTTSRNQIKVWSLRGEVKSIYSLDAQSQITRLELLEGRAIFGTASGSVLLIDMPSGRKVLSSSTSDHLDAITGIGRSVHLQHFVTSSRDRNIKVFDRDKVLKKVIYLATPLTCCCYLNDEGDILIGIGSRLVVVKADLYEWVTGLGDGMGGPGEAASRTSIYEGWRGIGTRPSNLLRAEASSLHKLSSAKVPEHVLESHKRSRHHLAKGTVRTSPVRLLKMQNTMAAAVKRTKSGGGDLSDLLDTHPAGMAPLPSPSPRTTLQPARPAAKGASEKKGAKWGNTWSSSQKDEVVPLEQPASAAPPEVVDAAAVVEAPLAVTFDQFPDPGEDDGSDEPQRAAGLQSDGDSDGGESESGSEDDSREGEEDELSGSGSDEEEGAGEKQAQDSRRKWRAREEAMQQQRVMELLQAFQRSNLVPTRYTLDVRTAAEQVDRRLKGLTSTKELKEEAGAPPATIHRGMAAASNVQVDEFGRAVMKVGQLQVPLSSADLDPEQARRPGVTSASSAGDAVGPSSRQLSAQDLHEMIMKLPDGAGDGLAAIFRKALPLICSGSAFLDDSDDGQMPLKFKKTKLTPGFKKPKKKKNKATAADLKDPAAMLLAKLGGAEEAGLPATDAGGEGKKKKKKSKRRRRRAAAADLDPVKALTRHGAASILQELKDYQLHQMLNMFQSNKGPGAPAKRQQQQREQLQEVHRPFSREPPSPTRLLDSLRNGWPGVHQDSAEQDEALVKEFLPKIQASAANRAQSLSTVPQPLGDEGRQMTAAEDTAWSQAVDSASSCSAVSDRVALPPVRSASRISPPVRTFLANAASSLMRKKSALTPHIAHAAAAAAAGDHHQPLATCSSVKLRAGSQPAAADAGALNAHNPVRQLLTMRHGHAGVLHAMENAEAGFAAVIHHNITRHPSARSRANTAA